MKKSIISCALAMLAIVAFVTGCGKKSPVAYAPADADLIAYVNAKKISENKIFTTLRAREDAKTAIAEAEKQIGLKIDDLLKSQGAIFANTKTFDGGNVPAASAVVCFDKTDMTKEIFAAAKKAEPGLKDAKVGGKTAITAPDGSGAAIALNGETLQISAKQGDKPFACLTETNAKLAEKIDKDALISIAYKVGDEARKMLKEAAGEVVPNDITFVTANVREKNDSIFTELVFTFEKAESAKKAQEFLVSQRDAFKGTADDPQVKKSLEGIKIEAKGQTLTLTASEKIDEIIATINKMAPAPAAPAAK